MRNIRYNRVSIVTALIDDREPFFFFYRQHGDSYASHEIAVQFHAGISNPTRERLTLF